MIYKDKEVKLKDGRSAVLRNARVPRDRVR